MYIVMYDSLSIYCTGRKRYIHALGRLVYLNCWFWTTTTAILIDVKMMFYILCMYYCIWMYNLCAYIYISINSFTSGFCHLGYQSTPQHGGATVDRYIYITCVGLHYDHIIRYDHLISTLLYNYIHSTYVTHILQCVVGVSSNGLLLCTEAISSTDRDHLSTTRRTLHNSVCHYQLACPEEQYCTWRHLHTSQSPSRSHIQYVCLQLKGS